MQAELNLSVGGKPARCIPTSNKPIAMITSVTVFILTFFLLTKITYAQTVSIAANKHKVQDVHTQYEDGNCVNFGATLNTSGFPPNESPIVDAWKHGASGYDQWPVGYRNYKKQGSDPAPCNKWNLAATQLAVSFDLSSIPSSSVIRSIHLSWQYAPFDETLLVPGFATRRPYKACFGEGFEIGLLSEQFDSGRESMHSRRGCPPSDNPFIGCLSNSTLHISKLLPYSLRVPVEFPAEVRNESETEYRFQKDISFLVPDDLQNMPDFYGFVLSPPLPPALVPRVFERTSNREKYQHCVKLISDVQLHVSYRP